MSLLVWSGTRTEGPDEKGLITGIFNLSTVPVAIAMERKRVGSSRSFGGQVFHECLFV